MLLEGEIGQGGLACSRATCEETGRQEGPMLLLAAITAGAGVDPDPLVPVEYLWARPAAERHGSVIEDERAAHIELRDQTFVDNDGVKMCKFGTRLTLELH